MKKDLRAFISVPITNRVIDQLLQIRKPFQTAQLPIRWVSTENIHLTLKFLGEIETARISDVILQMDKATLTVSPFSLMAKGLGVFPNLRRARVVWVGLRGDLCDLETLHGSLDDGLTTVGFSKENRRFHPHMTVGRIKRRVDGRILSEVMASFNEFATDSFVVDQLHLYKSVLTPAGAKYVLLHTSSVAPAVPVEFERNEQF